MTIEIKNIHLTEADFEKWENGAFSPIEMEAFLTHTASCPSCGDAWMAYMQRHSEVLEQPPAYLAEEIIERVHQPDAVLAQKAYTTSKRVQLFFYSLKISVALFISIYMLFAMDLQTLELMTQLLYR